MTALLVAAGVLGVALATVWVLEIVRVGQACAEADELEEYPTRGAALPPVWPRAPRSEPTWMREARQ